MTAEEREQELVTAVVPALREVWDAVDGPSTSVEHDALIRLNNVVAMWMHRYHRDLLPDRV